MQPSTDSRRPLTGRRALLLVGDDYEDLELWYPKLRLEEAGCHVVVAGERADAPYSGKHGYPARSDAAIAAMDAADQKSRTSASRAASRRSATAAGSRSPRACTAACG